MDHVVRKDSQYEYAVNNTAFKVTAVHRDAPGTERLEDKIKRLILNGERHKSVDI